MPTELDYIAWLRSGDQRGITYFFDQHYIRLSYYADRLIKDKETAEEIVSDVFVKIWKRGMNFETVNLVKAYLTIAVRNRCYNYLKQRKRKEEGLKDFSVPDIDENVSINNQIRAELLDLIKKEIDNHPGRLQEIFHYYMEGLSVQEIADKLGVKAHTVHSHLHRLRKLIHEKIKNRY